MLCLFYKWAEYSRAKRVHAPFISDYSRASKYLLMSTRDVALERYRISIINVIDVH